MNTRNIRFRDKNLWGKIKEITASVVVLLLIFGVPTAIVVWMSQDAATLEGMKDNSGWVNVLMFILVWFFAAFIMTFFVGFFSFLDGL